MGIGISEIKHGLTPAGRALQRYSNAYVFVNGQLLTQESSVTIEKKSNSKPMVTLHKGFAGLSKGAGMAEITVENAIPAKDIEFLPDFFIKEGDSLEIGSVLGSRQMICRGFVTDASYTHQINENAKLSFKATCRLEVFQ